MHFIRRASAISAFQFNFNFEKKNEDFDKLLKFFLLLKLCEIAE